MGLLTKLFNDAANTEFKLAQDLVAIAMADGDISEAERETIVDICQQEGINEETVDKCLRGFDKGTRNQIPAKRRDKANYLTKLIRVMGADGESSHMEIYLLEIVASKLGIGHLELVSLVLMTATRKNFPGDTGTRTLKSFLKNMIDPKGKPLSDNRENISNIFDRMAENIPQQQDEDNDKEAFVKAMDAATRLLLENTLLSEEFRTMGIDFKALLMTERALAIRRWTRRQLLYLT